MADTTASPIQLTASPQQLLIMVAAAFGLTWLVGAVTSGSSRPAARGHRGRYRAGSKMAEIHERHMERVEQEREEKAERKAKRVEAKQEQHEDDLAARLERGEVGGDVLRQLMGSGQLRVKRNPAGLSPADLRDLGKLTPTDRRQLAAARRLAETFHGPGTCEVIELEPGERKLPRFLAALGEIPALEYEPPADSQRAGAVYRHESGDRGFGQHSSPNRPVLAVAPGSKRPVIVPMRSPVRMDSKRGLVG